jgi:NAD(P)-dependent dehydrogenase (short-subunit alcohol dehydrogenase family)
MVKENLAVDLYSEWPFVAPCRMADVTSFEGRVVVVTGAGSGLGRSYAEAIAARGGAVVVNDLGVAVDGTGAEAGRAEQVAASIRSGGGRAVASADSVADAEGCDRMVQCALDTWGRIDAVVHSAGNIRNGPFATMPEADVRALLDTHLVGAFLLTQRAFREMAGQGYGRVVFTSSASGLFGRPNGANYAMAKAGLIGLCNGVAIEGAEHGILANAVLPVAVTRLVPPPAADAQGPLVDTLRALTDGDRGEPEWVAPLVLHLASERCTRTRRYYSAVRGRFAEVFVGVSEGWMADGPEPPSPEELEARLDAIESKEAFDLPEKMADELALVTARLDAR